jgi:hypothetical protein
MNVTPGELQLADIASGEPEEDRPLSHKSTFTLDAGEEGLLLDPWVH